MESELIPAEAAGPWFGLWHIEDKAFTAFSTNRYDLERTRDEYGFHLEVRRVAWVFYEELES